MRAAAAPYRRSTAGTPRHGRQPNHRPDQNFRRVCEVRGGSPAPWRRRACARVRLRRRRRVAPPPRRPTGTGARQLSIPRSTRPGRGEVGPRAGSARARGMGARHRAARVRRERRTRRREVRRRRGWRVRRRRRTARGRRRLRRTRRAGSIREARDSRRRGRGRRDGRARRRGYRRDARVGRRGGRGVGRPRPRTSGGGESHGVFVHGVFVHGVFVHGVFVLVARVRRVPARGGLRGPDARVARGEGIFSSRRHRPDKPARDVQTRADDARDGGAGPRRRMGHRRAARSPRGSGTLRVAPRGGGRVLRRVGARRVTRSRRRRVSTLRRVRVVRGVPRDASRVRRGGGARGGRGARGRRGGRGNHRDGRRVGGDGAPSALGRVIPR